MPVVIATPTSQRLDRVLGDIVDLMQAGDSAVAKQRALRWVAHVLADAGTRRRWWFLERLVQTTLSGGQDVVDVLGDLHKVGALYAPGRLAKVQLATIARLRMDAQANARPNAGVPKRYAIEHLAAGGVRLHLWPAPPLSSSTPFTASAATDELTVAASATLATTGRAVRLTTAGTLPAPLVGTATYYVIRVSDTAIKLATSAANAKAGTAIDLTDAGTGAHTILWGLTPLALLYTVPLDLAVTPAHWETIVVNGVLGTFGRHFDVDQLADDPEAFERRYESQLKRAGSDSHDIDTVPHWDTDEAASDVSASSGLDTATSYTVPASLTGIGYVTIEAGAYPLVVT